jgi:hypothetical protein
MRGLLVRELGKEMDIGGKVDGVYELQRKETVESADN